MILPIVAYGNSVLKIISDDIVENNKELEELIKNMFETMYNAQGVGLAAPQVGKLLRLFIVDASPYKIDEPELDGFKKVFINPVLKNEMGKEWSFNEGCLSIPEIRENVIRKSKVEITYLDQNFKKHTDTFDGLKARIIQHEYDHLEGILFVDKLNPIRKRFLTKKLNNIARAEISVPYPMKFVNFKKRK